MTTSRWPDRLDGNGLTIATSDFSESMYYQAQGDSVAIPDSLWIHARLRIVAESHTPNNPRYGIAIGFTVAPDTENLLLLGIDEVFLWSALGVQGPTAFVETDDAVYTYSVLIRDKSTIEVFYDYVPLLQGVILTDARFTNVPTIWWGDGTGSASGTSEWWFFKHNGSSIECTSPTGVGGEISLGGERPLQRSPSIVASPNPANDHVVFSILGGAIDGSARVVIYDISGRIVRTLVLNRGDLASGRVAWGGEDKRGQTVASGRYLYRVEHDGKPASASRVTIIR